MVSASPPAREPAPAADTGRPAGSIRLGSLRGAGVYLGSSWFIIALLLVLYLGPQLESVVPGTGWVAYGAAGAYAVLLLVSVLVHEFAHALTALSFGYQVDRIVADLLGGHTVYRAAGPTPGRQALVAVAGPAANAVLAVAGALAAREVSDPLTWVLLGAITWTNTFVAVFNLLPGMPLDGGHVVEALVWKVTGSRSKGTLLAGWLGRLVVIGGALYLAAVTFGPGARFSLWNIAMFALVGAYLWTGSAEAIRSARTLLALERIDPRTLLHPVRVITQDAPLSAIPATAAGEDADLPAVIVVADAADPATLLGYLDPQATSEALAAGASQAPASSCLRACPPGWVVDADPASVTAQAIAAWMNERRQPLLVLRGPGGPFAVADAHVLAQALPG